MDSFSWPAKRASITDDTSKAGEIHPRFGHQCRQAGQEVERLDKIAGSDFEQPKADPKGVGQDARSNIPYGSG